MVKSINRRSLVKGASLVAGATALGAPSLAFAQGTATPVASTGTKAELVLWTSFGSGANGDAQKKLVEDFNALGTGITVKTSIYENYEAVAQALVTGLQTGDIPDMAILSDVWWFRFYLSQSLEDLTGKLDKTDDYQQPLFVEYQRNGGQWAVPFARSTPLLYYNKEALDKAGMDPKIFETWDSFKAAAKDLTAKSGLPAFGFASAASYAAWVLHGPVWAFDGNYSDKDFNIKVAEEGCVATGDFMQKLVTDGVAKAVNDPETDFATGGFAAILASTGSLGGITKGAQFKFGTAFSPAEKKFGCCTGGSGLAIMKDAKDDHKAAALEYLKFATNTERAAMWSQATGYMPVRTSAVQSQAFQDFLAKNPNNKVAIDQLPKTQPQDTARVFIPNGDQILGRGWEQILVKNVPAKDAWAEVKSTLDEEKQPVLEQLKKIEG